MVSFALSCGNLLHYVVAPLAPLAFHGGTFRFALRHLFLYPVAWSTLPHGTYMNINIYLNPVRLQVGRGPFASRSPAALELLLPLLQN